MLITGQVAMLVMMMMDNFGLSVMEARLSFSTLLVEEANYGNRFG